MAGVTTRQYMPVLGTETDTDDAISVRAVRDLADSLNNFKANFGPHIPPLMWPVESASGYSLIRTAPNTTTEQVLFWLPRVWVGNIYNTMRISASGKCVSKPASQSVTFKLYAMSKFRPELVDTVDAGDVFGAPYCEFRYDDDAAYQLKHASATLNPNFSDTRSNIWLLLTGQNSSAAASFLGYLVSLSISFKFE